MSAALCRPGNPDGISSDLFFKPPGSEGTRQAKAICMACPLYWKCQEYALNEGIPEGVFGGLDAADRARIWSKRGGKPTKFLEAIDQNFMALLIERREREKRPA